MLEEFSVGEYLVTLKEHASTCSGTVYLKGQAVFSCEDAKNRGELLGRLAEEAFSASSTPTRSASEYWPARHQRTTSFGSREAVMARKEADEALDRIRRLIDSGVPVASSRFESAFDEWQRIARKDDRRLDAVISRQEMFDASASTLSRFSLSVVVYGGAFQVEGGAEESVDRMLQAQRSLIMAVADNEVDGSVDYLSAGARLQVLLRAGVSSLCAAYLVGLGPLSGVMGPASSLGLVLSGVYLTFVVMETGSLLSSGADLKTLLESVFASARLQSDFISKCKDFVAAHPRPVCLREARRSTDGVGDVRLL